MIDYKIVLGYFSIVIGIISYIPYFRGIFAGRTKPHAFSWLVWGATVGIVFAAQVVKRGGAGSWVTGLTAFICFTIFFLALKKGTKKFIFTDWLSLAAAGTALILWRLAHDPTWSVILITLTDACGFWPTLRKGYYKPEEDSPWLWLLTAPKWVVAIIALQQYSLATVLYPTYLLIVNLLFATLLIVRRKQKTARNLRLHFNSHNELK